MAAFPPAGGFETGFQIFPFQGRQERCGIFFLCVASATRSGGSEGSFMVPGMMELGFPVRWTPQSGRMPSARAELKDGLRGWRGEFSGPGGEAGDLRGRPGSGSGG